MKKLVLVAAVVTLFASIDLLWAADTGGKPNIVLIVADDLGYADLGVQGCQDIPTPNIDSIAKNGIRFTSGYVTCPVCSPSRAGFMTGRYQERFGHEFNPGKATPREKFGLPLSETTVAQRLKSAGYETGMFGKWHLGSMPEYFPLQRGFGEFLGFLGGMHVYRGPGQGANVLLRGHEPVSQVTYTTDMFGDAAAEFIEKNRDHAFFLYLPFNAVHVPLQATKKYLQRFAGIEDEKRRKFAAMASAMDDNVGKVLAKIRELVLEGNTLIFFISDNGGPTFGNTSSNKPLRGYKGQVLEGGIRIPFMIQWKGHLPAGKVLDEPVISLDIPVTALAAAGVTTAVDWKLDGVNLLPYLSGSKSGSPHDALFWRYGVQHAVRVGDWKLVVPVEEGKVEKTQLYNLRTDIGEAHDLAAAQPEKLKELQARFDQWNVQLMQPRWPGDGNASLGKEGPMDEKE